jgi:hypothetical protein
MCSHRPREEGPGWGWETYSGALVVAVVAAQDVVVVHRSFVVEFVVRDEGTLLGHLLDVEAAEPGGEQRRSEDDYAGLHVAALVRVTGEIVNECEKWMWEKGVNGVEGIDSCSSSASLYTLLSFTFAFS